MREVKTRGLQRLAWENQCFYQNMQCVWLRKTRCIKEQESNGFLSSLETRTNLNKMLIVGHILF